MLGVERDQQRDDRVPRVGSPRTDDVAGHFTLEPVAVRHSTRHRISFTHRLVTINRLVITLGNWFEDARVEHTHVAGESDDHQLLVEGGDDSSGHRVFRFHQHFEPFAEAIDVELLVAACESDATDRGRAGR